MSLYSCSGCFEFINASKARIHCTTCSPSSNLCTNCYVLQQYPSGHVISHSITLSRESGLENFPSPPPPPPQFSSSHQQIQLSQQVAASANLPRRRPVPVHVLSAPPRLPPRPSVSDSSDPDEPPDARQDTGSTLSDASPSQQEPSPLEAAGLPTSVSWRPMFNRDLTPSQSFIELLTALFQHLDPQRTGFLSPDTYVSLLEVMGVEPRDNVWKHTRVGVAAGAANDIADYALRQHYLTYSIDFSLRPRTPSPSASPFGSYGPDLQQMPAYARASLTQIMSAAKPRTLSDGQKPMLTFRGFIDITTLGTLSDPSAAWGNLNRALREYQLMIWQQRGDIPRNVLPEHPNEAVLDKIRIWNGEAAERAETLVNSVQVEAKFRRMGQRNALELIDDGAWVRRW